MSKLFASDLDNTLLDIDSSISKINIQTIHEFINKNNYFVIATGRPPFRVQGIIENLKLKVSNQYSILLNGSLIINNTFDQVIYQCVLETEICQKLIAWAKELKCGILVYLKNEILAHNIPECCKSLKYLSCVKQVDNYNNLLVTEDIYKIIYLGSAEEINQYKNIICDLFTYDINYVCSSANYLEMFSKKTDKGTAILKLAEYLKIDNNNICAIGDEENDLSMIEKVNNSFAVANAIEPLRKAAKIVVNTNHLNGVAEALRIVMDGEK